MPDEQQDEKQCRICLDGEAPELGRLIRPCLCKGSISHVHVKCLQRWRTTSPSRTAFYSCPQCGYKYHFARTRAIGLATNPIVIAAVSAVFFTILVLCSSFVTTWLLSDDGQSGFSYTLYYYPVEVFKSLVRNGVRILVDDRILDQSVLSSGKSRKLADHRPRPPSGPPSLIQRFVRRFLLGLPVVGAGSIAQMLLSIPLPVHWIRFRTLRGRGRSRDLVAIMILAIILIGVLRAIWKVYQLVEKWTKRLLLRAENAILEVA
ncbi:zf-C3HC4-domain-containing protein [Obba rivulosa]|uniref:Zf-C3HC4-domain-containing protein n=1 Tax=Obba rivulosa TaxID=1052685 RepID=A0A8E2DUG2_9APHY|nr:zf-C3HC4-domain-containing protein [Obba rivulosa]